MGRPYFSEVQNAKATDFVRTIKALALARGKNFAAVDVAKRAWGEDAAPTRFLKTAQTAGTLSPDGNWGSELGAWEGATAAFYELVRQRSILGRLQGIRRVPLLVRLIGQNDGVTAFWVGEGMAVPVSEAQFTEGSLKAMKVAALSVITSELAQSSDPSAEAVVKADLVNALAEAIDLSLLNPANAGIADIQPASVTNGVTAIPSTNPADDLNALIADFPGDLGSAYLVGSPETLAAMSGADRPLIGARGGSAAGIPAIPTKAAGNTLALIDASAIALAEGPAEIRVATDATIEMTNTPSVGPANTVSLWQTDSVGILTTKAINWRGVRPGVKLVTGVSY